MISLFVVITTIQLACSSKYPRRIYEYNGQIVVKISDFRRQGFGDIYYQIQDPVSGDFETIEVYPLDHLYKAGDTINTRR